MSVAAKLVEFFHDSRMSIFDSSFFTVGAKRF